MSKSSLFNIYLLPVLNILCCISCQNPGPTASPPGYDLTKPDKIDLPNSLNEISGIAYYPPDHALICQNDEDGKIFKLDVDKREVVNTCKFSGKGDYEDICFTGNEWYILKSNGDLYLVKNSFTDSCGSEIFPFIEKRSEFEGMYYDHESDLLYIMCKDCRNEPNHETTSFFAFNVTKKQWIENAGFNINIADIFDPSRDKDRRFKPSAIAYNPVDSLFYILSAVNNMLITAGRDFQVKKIYPLSKSLFKQPEGICFNSAGDMFISNESADKGPANILLFKRIDTNTGK